MLKGLKLSLRKTSPRRSQLTTHVMRKDFLLRNSLTLALHSLIMRQGDVSSLHLCLKGQKERVTTTMFCHAVCYGSSSCTSVRGGTPHHWASGIFYINNRNINCAGFCARLHCKCTPTHTYLSRRKTTQQRSCRLLEPHSVCRKRWGKGQRRQR